jgi:hypothetical protein
MGRDHNHYVDGQTADRQLQLLARLRANAFEQFQQSVFAAIKPLHYHFVGRSQFLSALTTMNHPTALSVA